MKLMNLLYVPALLLFLVFTIYPLFSGFKLSFMNWDGYSIEKTFAGFSNYLAIFQDEYFGKVMLNTIIFALGCTAIQQVLGMILSVILDQKFRGCNLARTIIYMPVLVSPVIMGSIYYMLLQYNGGAFNDVVLLFGGNRIAWLTDENIAVLWIVIINSIQFVGTSMILYLTGLQNISTMYYEASKIDGASTFQTFKYITLPLLHPAIVTSVTLNLIGGFKLFDIIKVLTNGGPGYSTNSISTYISLMYFNGEKAGYASAIGIILFLIILFASLILNIGFTKWEEHLNG
ncbi:MAG: sugar ABC transporter permease [Lachnospiraceae bacterium]